MCLKGTALIGIKEQKINPPRKYLEESLSLPKAWISFALKTGSLILILERTPSSKGLSAFSVLS